MWLGMGECVTGSRGVCGWEYECVDESGGVCNWEGGVDGSALGSV